MRWKEFITTNPWIALFSFVGSLIGFVKWFVSKPLFIISSIPESLAYALAGGGSVLFLLYLIDKFDRWEGRHKIWNDILKPIGKSIYEVRSVILGLVIIIAIGFFVIWIINQAPEPKSTWIWAHKDSRLQNDSNRMEHDCRVRAFEAIRSSGHNVFATSHVEREREKYVESCMIQYGFTRHKVDSYQEIN